MIDIEKHIKDWEDSHNLYNRIDTDTQPKVLQWHRETGISEIWRKSIMTWNSRHRRQCRSVNELEECFKQHGIRDIKREMYGRLYISMTHRTYMIQVFNEEKTCGLICDCVEEERHFMNMNAQDIVDFLISFDRLIPKINATINHVIFRIQQEKHADKIAKTALSPIMRTLIGDKQIKYHIQDIYRGHIKVVLYPAKPFRFHLIVTMPFEGLKERMGNVIAGFDLLLSEMNENDVHIDLISYSYH